ncbi:glutamate--tRNA ligase [Futiania mangrovi]|uniref:Glutamate--tRNA ligase n=1 Tax=Futiania mangrovi TaxID=2959716 RepID=A0A9J6PI99_9PROT|nr:glutamate--tRNA ligase [Futiania mangrovii]MCP1335810.1 glutamate--tRNA ligase [Futiania mangrovii]
MADPRTVVTRFAPSPTGFLHIGNARTALFNWLYARHTGGKFLLRIEDTDRARSTDAAIQAIFDGLRWLGLDWDGDAVFQFSRMDTHAREANRLLDEGKAYRCYMTGEELEAERARARSEGGRVESPWRDRDWREAPAGRPFAVRFRAPRAGETVIRDIVQGEVRIPNTQLDDMVLLRSDGTPTYMLSVVVDDHDMGVTHVVRGDDHLTNAARQMQLIEALGWSVPVYAHIALIHGPDGAKLSKRHGALGVDWYRDQGYLPAAMRNYLARLGWGHGDDEIFTTEQAIAWFDIADLGKSPSRLDFEKMRSVNAHYLRAMPAQDALAALEEFATAHGHAAFNETQRARIAGMLDALRERASTLADLLDQAAFLLTDEVIVPDDAAAAVLTEEARARLGALADALADVEPWTAESLEAAVKAHLKDQGLKLGAVGPAIRACLVGRTASPSLFAVLGGVGRETALMRLRAAARPA